MEIEGAYDKIAFMIYNSFLEELQRSGIEIAGIDENSGAIYIPNTAGETLLVRLENLIDYYYKTRDENAVKDFVNKIKSALIVVPDPTWEEVKENIFISVYPNASETRSPYAKDVTGFFNRFYVLDTPTLTNWIFPDMVEKWGISESDLERQALANGDKLLSEVSIAIKEIDGYPLGAFRVKDRNLTAACLFAPGMKEKVSKDFGWPLYVVFPNKVDCFFFRRDHYDYLIEHISALVVEQYANARRITPELLEFSDEGIKSIYSLTS